MPITEEQRQRAEANRLAAIAKRKAFTESLPTNYQQEQPPEDQNPWPLFKCRKLSSKTAHNPKPPHVSRVGSDPNTLLPEKFRLRLEICSPDSFFVAPEALQGFRYPGEEECLSRLAHWLSEVMPSHYTQNHGGMKACVYKLRDYDAVLMCLKNYKEIEIQKIPYGTLNVIQRLSNSFETGRWEPCRPEHLTDEKVDELIGKLPKKLLDALLPFQMDGVRFGLRRGGRCLIADEMGLGKTLQAIAIAGCFIHEGPILVVCPAVLRFSWAEELERWLTSCLPSEIHLVFGHQNNPAHLARWPRIVVISYTMLRHLRNSMLQREWALLIVDESHHLRCSKKKSEPKEIKAVLDVAAKINRMVLLSGTPSLSRPGLLGQNKYDFAKTYCDLKYVLTSEGKGFQDFSKGIRLEELNVLLRQTVMIRRLKEHVLKQLPPKRRQIIRLLLKRSDIISAKAAVGEKDDDSENNDDEDMDSENLEDNDDCGFHYRSSQLSYQELGIAKLSGFREWLSIHPLISESHDKPEFDVKPCSQKMIIFAHHHKVLDRVQEFMCEKGVCFVRIDGNTLAWDRQLAVQSFRSSNECGAWSGNLRFFGTSEKSLHLGSALINRLKVKIGIIGITAGGVGLDFSSAQNVVFLELPQSPSLMLQAEDRAHRRGQTNAVNIYIFCAQDTMDERQWQYLNKSLHRVSSTTNGKYDALPKIAVDGVSYLKTSGKTKRNDEVPAFEKVSCSELPVVELLELSDSDMEHDMETSKRHGETSGMLSLGVKEHKCGSSSVQHDAFHLEANVVINSETKANVAENVNSKGNVSEAEIGCNGRISGNLREQNGSNDEHQKEREFCSQRRQKDDAGFPLRVEEDGYHSNQVYSLRFEVSKYTGRIHLYSCIPGIDSRPRPLFENFRPEELESLGSTVDNENEEAISISFKGNPAYRDGLLAFVNEWNVLRPVEKRKLLGKTLQLPLSIELGYLNESINHDSGGLLKGGSKRRNTPWYEISGPLPSNAVWKKVHLSSGYGTKKKEYTQGWSLMDEPLCKLCQTPCKGDNAKMPEYFEDLFCKLSCYEEYRTRTSTRSIRQELFQIERGVCTNCRLDCHQLVRSIKPLSLERRREYIQKLAPQLANREKLLDKLVNDPSEGNSWHADHIIPVYRGGGECRLENMRTLCVACHADVTAAQRAERRSIRAEARKQLKAIMNLIDDRNGESAERNVKGGQGLSQMQEETPEDELLITVPGSAYSGVKETEPGED